VVRQGGKIVIDQLAAQGVARLFMVPGESFLPALDALYDHQHVQGIVCRHEGGAAMAAEATGKLEGRPGVVFVTRGPGAANAVAGVYVAHTDETPLVLLVGLPPQRLADRRPFQDIDLERLFSGLSKWTTVVRETSELPEVFARAFRTALSDRPGPVVIGLPQNVLEDSADVADAPRSEPAEAAPSREALAAIEGALGHAQRPMMIVGGPGWTASAKANAEAFALRFDIPVVTAFRCQDYIDNDHAQFIGHLGFGRDATLDAAIRDADLLMVVGAPLGEVVTAGHSVIAHPDPEQALVHVHPSAAEIGMLHRTRLGIVSSSPNFLTGLRTLEPPQDKPWRGWRRDLRNATLKSRQPLSVGPSQPTAGVATPAVGVALDAVVHHVFKILPRNAIVTNGAGNYAQFVHRFGTFRSWRSNLAPVSGSMGYGLPAAIAAKLQDPDRPVVCFAGDGCLMMSLPELATAVQYGLPIIILVANNGLFGTIRLHQELAYPGRASGTALVNPDFAALAESFGAYGERVETTAAFPDAFARAANAGRPAVLDLMVEADVIAPGRRLSELQS
jgi:acetolactate synthase I/II/III large subunit